MTGELERLQPAMDAVTDGVAVFDGDWRVVFVNASLCAIFGRTPEESLGLLLEELVPPDAERFWEAHHRAVATGEPTETEAYYPRIGRWLESRIFPSGGQHAILTRDTTAARRTADLLAGQATLLSAVVAAATPLEETLDGVAELAVRTLAGAIAMVWVLDEDTGLLHLVASEGAEDEMRRAAARLPVGPDGGAVGRAAELGAPVQVRRSDPGGFGRFAELAARVGIGTAWCQPLDRRDGTVGGVLCCYQLHEEGPTSDEQRHLVLLAEVAALALDRDRLDRSQRERALHDPLTGLPNRALLQDRTELALESAARSGYSVGLVFCDVDRLKPVNDQLGHVVGDELLVALGRRLRAAARAGDTVARLGGDEFVVLCQELRSPDEAVVVAKRLLAAATAPLVLQGAELRPSLSLGVATTRPSRDQDRAAAARDLLRDADTAMYQAKRDDHGRVRLFAQAMRAAEERRWQLEQALRTALDRPNGSPGGLRVHYQPQVDVAQGRVVGLEALVRWSDPADPVPPSEFVPVAEATGLVGRLGHQVLHVACQDTARLVRAGLDLRVSVNVSARQLLDPGFVGEVDEALAAAELPGGRLCLEVTESVLVEDAPELLGTLDLVRSRGIGIAIDDIGTGYSSLRYLKRLPVTELKVDTSFVAGLGASAEDEAIVGAVVGLGSALGLEVVAEGVETPAQRATLLELGCPLAQGWLFAPAMEVGALERLLLERPVLAPEPAGRG
ncbi:sensor domain-containing protein [Motilibacter rhizosphaerae]|nr:EAL domain-containing protein [Motilibacter rhizosphaerae]